MIVSIGDNIKWEKSENVIPLYKLALRWPHDFPAVICFHIHEKDISLYECIKYSQDVENRTLCKLFRITENHSYEKLLAKMPNLFFRWQEVDAVEGNHPEYRRVREELSKNKTDIQFATSDNISAVVAGLLFFLSKFEKFISPILFDYVAQEHGRRAVLTDKLYKEIDVTPLEKKQLYPDIQFEFNEEQPLTVFEKAKLFISKCAIKNKCDKLLALIELDRRFPELTSAEVGSLLPANKDAVILEESMEKHCLRLRKEAYKYSNIKI